MSSGPKYLNKIIDTQRNVDENNYITVSRVPADDLALLC